jgi:leader peptidase (prepilin peptidase)/N-methyltransferase
MALAFLGAFGAAIGSFVNVLAYRLPRRESIVKPRSSCTACRTPIAPYDNIPVVSWLLLRGRCRHCGDRISIRYPIVEALTGVLFVVVGLKIGIEPELLPSLALVLTLVAAAETDLEHRIIPNRLLAPAAVAAIVLWAIADPGRLPENLIAGAAAGGLMLLTAVAYPAGMGMGDVKLAAMLGAFLGRAVSVALMSGLLLAAVPSILVLARLGVKGGRKETLPLGPFLALGGLLALLFGHSLLDWYWGARA